MPRDNQHERQSPINPVTGAEPDASGAPEHGIALCLSGGGYRAMLFHAGAIWRLSELGFLPKLNRVSSVSGGSIIAALLGLRWPRLGFDANGVARNLVAEVIDPIRALAGRTIDQGAIIGGLMLPGAITDRVADAYRQHLYGDATLQDLPADPHRFVINATNVQTGSLFRFSRPYIADFRLGTIKNPTLDLALAVTASSAFPPVLSPVQLEFEASAWVKTGGEDLHREPYLTNVVLTDGGVYDNLGLETAWKRYDTILVSNGGGKMAPQEEPKGDWVRHAIRINEIIDNQVRNLRTRQVIGSFEAKERKGTYWGIRTDIADYQLASAMPCAHARTTELAETKTRLQRMDAERQERLINWGYAVCDAGMRKHVVTAASAPAGFPDPAAGV